jgi:hypothetical protein
MLHSGFLLGSRTNLPWLGEFGSLVEASGRYSTDVPINIAVRIVPTCGNAGQYSAWPSVDNCHSDDAVTNAVQLVGLLSSADVPVVPATA